MIGFRRWLCETQRREGDLDILNKEFQVGEIPPVVTIPGGTKLPNGEVIGTNLEYKTEILDKGSDGAPGTIKLVRSGEDAPFGKKVQAPETIRLSWDEFQKLWGSVLSSIPMGGMGGGMGGGMSLDNPLGGPMGGGL